MLENNIKNLIKILEESNIDELEVATFWGKQKIRIRKNANLINENDITLPQDTSSLSLQSTPKPNETSKSKQEPFVHDEKTKEGELIDDEKIITIQAPLVGTYYSSVKPDAPPFISEGDTIKEGQIICIIEAMKIFNEIESEISGKVIKILVKDGSPVEYDQDLIVVAPE